MAQTFTFQGKYSRNSHDWTMKKGADGRFTFSANEKGVAARIGYLVEYLYEYPRSNVQEMTEYLQTIHRSYSSTDVSQPIRRMVEAGIVRVNGTGRDATYSLTNNGRRIWTASKKEFV